MAGNVFGAMRVHEETHVSTPLSTEWSPRYWPQSQHTMAVHTGLPERTFPRPAGLARVEICRLSGKLPTEACPYRSFEWFISGTEPILTDTICTPGATPLRSGLSG